jgi:hypothetical protein
MILYRPGRRPWVSAGDDSTGTAGAAGAAGRVAAARQVVYRAGTGHLGELVQEEGW